MRFISDKKALAVLMKSGVIGVKCHGGRESQDEIDVCVDRTALLVDQKKTSRWCDEIARRFVKDDARIIVGFGESGLALAQWTAFHLMKMYQNDTSRPSNDVLSVTMQPNTFGKLGFGPGEAKYVRGKRLLFVTDFIVDRAFPIHEIVKLIKSAGGIIVGIGAVLRIVDFIEQDLTEIPKIVSVVNHETIRKYCKLANQSN